MGSTTPAEPPPRNLPRCTRPRREVRRAARGCDLLWRPAAKRGKVERQLSCGTCGWQVGRHWDLQLRRQHAARPVHIPRRHQQRGGRAAASDPATRRLTQRTQDKEFNLRERPNPSPSPSPNPNPNPPNQVVKTTTHRMPLKLAQLPHPPAHRAAHLWKKLMFPISSLP